MYLLIVLKETNILYLVKGKHNIAYNLLNITGIQLFLQTICKHSVNITLFPSNVLKGNTHFSVMMYVIYSLVEGNLIFSIQ